MPEAIITERLRTIYTEDHVRDVFGNTFTQYTHHLNRFKEENFGVKVGVFFAAIPPEGVGLHVRLEGRWQFLEPSLENYIETVGPPGFIYTPEYRRSRPAKDSSFSTWRPYDSLLQIMHQRNLVLKSGVRGLRLHTSPF